MLLRSLLVLLACLSLAFAATPAQAAQVKLTWDAPVQADGTPVSSLAGYKLYYGSQSGQYPTMIPVGMTTTYLVISFLLLCLWSIGGGLVSLFGTWVTTVRHP